MTRQVIVFHYDSADSRSAVGSAVLNKDGSAELIGFTGPYAPMRREWETKGILDKRPGGDRVELSDGAAFLDLLLMEFTGAYVRAVDIST